MRRRIKCHRSDCGNVWWTTSEKRLVNCTSCGRKVNVKACTIEVEN